MKPGKLEIFGLSLPVLFGAFLAAAIVWGPLKSSYAQTTGQNFADEETPGGSVNGVTQFFTLRQVPVVPSVKLYRNGIRQTRGVDYAVYPSTKRIGFYPCCLPQIGDILRIDYRY